MRKITPSSDNASMLALCSTGTSGNGGVYGPTMTPAMMYPSTTGWRRRWNTIVTSPATIITIARSWMNATAACTGVEYQMGHEIQITRRSGGTSVTPNDVLMFDLLRS